MPRNSRTGHRTLNLRAISHATARLAQSAERKALNLVVVGSSPTVGVLFSISHLPLSRPVASTPI